MTTFGDQIYHLGGVPVGGMFTQGKCFFVDPTSGSDGNSGEKIDQAVATLAAGYALLTAGRNDILYYLSGTTTLTMAATLTWAKAYTHLIGIGAPMHCNQRTRIMHSANFSPMITLSATGCSFRNLYFSYGRGGADNHILLTVTGARAYFENVHFAGMNHATEGADAASQSVVLNSTGGDFTFRDCTIGHDTIARTEANASLEITAAQHVLLRDCNFPSYATADTPVHIRVADASGLRFMHIKNCVFHNVGTSLVQSMDVNLTDAVNGSIICTDGTVFKGVTDVADATGDGFCWFKPDTATANVAGLATAYAVA